jgi:hypothetical protein
MPALLGFAAPGGTSPLPVRVVAENQSGMNGMLRDLSPEADLLRRRSGRRDALKFSSRKI